MNNVFTALPKDQTQEHFEDLLVQPGVKLERIVSYGQSTPPDEWYDQAWDEWVMLVQGAASLRLEEHDRLVHMKPGDHMFLPAHCRHRVESTLPDQPTIWIALHLGDAAVVSS